MDVEVPVGNGVDLGVPPVNDGAGCSAPERASMPGANMRYARNVMDESLHDILNPPEPAEAESAKSG